jgi:hypothetical protein
MTEYANGGIVYGPRDPDDDSIPAFFGGGCAIVPSDALRRYGREFLAALGNIEPENVHAIDE